MSKFTIFTIILAVSVITIFGDLLVRDYVKGEGLTSILSADGKTTETDISPVLEDTSSESDTVAQSEITAPAVETDSEKAAETAVETPSETQDTPVSTKTVASASFITEPLVTEAGFKGKLESVQFTGKIFQLLDIANFEAERIHAVTLTENSVLAASMTEIVLRDEIQALQLYLLLQNKTKPYIDLSLNETNAYGDRSFYINHAKKPNEAFLTVKIKNRIYAFAYVKFYHPELKKLITLLTQAN